MYAFTCPHCGAGVSYDLSNGAVSCEYCDSLITLDEYEAYLDGKGKYQTVELTCPQCGSLVLSYDNTIATFCSYCGSSVIFDRRVKEEQKPDGIIPFAFKQKAAVSRFRERTDRIMLAPDWMREEGEQKLTGIYMPYYLYSASCRAPISVKGEKRKNLGRRTEISVYQVDGTVDADYKGNRFDAAVAFPDALSESIDTYLWQKAQPFRPGYVAGFYADGSDVDPEEYDPVMARLVSDDINTTPNVRYDGMDLPLGGTTAAGNVTLTKQKILLPVWLLTHRSGERICNAAVNGQNGDVAADIPLDKGKYLKLSLVAAAVISTVLNLLFTIKPLPFLWISMAITGIFGILLGRLTQQAWIRENHLDDIGRVGYQAFAGAVKNIGSGAKKSKSATEFWGGVTIWAVLLFFVWPLLDSLLEGIAPDSFLATHRALVWVVLITLFVISSTSGLVHRQTGAPLPVASARGTRWKFSKSRAASFAVLWKVWLALAAGGIVIISGTFEDYWYYGAGILNILVSVWAAFDVIRKQNLLSSRDIPIFSMKRGGAE